ncbi:DUF3850 domain-containing protein [Enterobacter bugandensis]|uniref:DUF3850 domain-containing protein n=1 Tax=Enterobacter bugandensis TaxID=881260 RepID=UPI002FCFAD6B
MSTITREPVTHNLKIWPEYYSAVCTGVKRAELRKNDRDYRAGDNLHLMETPRGSCHATGEFINVTITHVADVGEWMPGYVLLSIAPASLEAEPVAYVDPFAFHNFSVYRAGATDNKRMGREWMWANPDAGLIPVYTAPPAPVSVPDEVLKRLLPDAEKAEFWFEHDGKILFEGVKFNDAVFEACRSAMLQGAEPVTKAYKLPMQPLVIDAHGTLRFKESPIVRALLDYATEHGYGLNEIAREEFDAEDQMQLAQLIGYSLSGYGTLSYVTDESYERAAEAAPQQEVK